MRTSRFTEQQVVAALRQVENGTAVAEVCRKLGVSEQTFYRWKRKYAGIGVAELRRLRQVEDENRRLKQLVARVPACGWHHARSTDAAGGAPKKLVTPARRRTVVQFFRSGFQVSERRACRVAGVPRTTMRYRSRARDQSPLRQRIKELAAVRVRYGYRRLHILLRREGWRVNAKRVYRLYREEGLSLRLTRPKKRVSVPRVTPPPAARPNERWSIDFLRDSLADGRPFRVFTVVDNVTKVSPAIAVAFSITGEAVVAVLDRLKATVGLPKRLAVDNGPEFISKALDAWAYRNGVTLEFSRPGKPTDNAFVESFNGHFRQECLDQHWFAELSEAREIIEAWRIEYNTERPHQALKHGTPTEFAAAWELPKEAADERIRWTNSGFRSILRESLIILGHLFGGQVSAAAFGWRRFSIFLVSTPKNPHWATLIVLQMLSWMRWSRFGDLVTPTLTSGNSIGGFDDGDRSCHQCLMAPSVRFTKHALRSAGIKLSGADSPSCSPEEGHPSGNSTDRM